MVINKKLIMLVLLYGFLIASITIISSAVWWDTDWEKRIEINVTENSGITFANYSVLLNLSVDNDMNGIEDLRFTNDTSELSHWVLSNDTNDILVWVKVPILTASSDTTIYAYYGNTTVSSTSNIETTFLAGTDCEYDDPFSNGWDEIGTVDLTTTSDWSVSGEKSCFLDGAGTGNIAVYNLTSPFYATDFENNLSLFEIQIRPNSSSNTYYPTISNDADPSTTFTDWSFITYISSSPPFRWNHDAGWEAMGGYIPSPNEWFSSYAYSNFTSYQTNWTLINLQNSSVVISAVRNNTLTGQKVDAIRSIAWLTYNHDAWIDNMILRKYTEPQPSYVIGSEQTGVPSDTINPNVTINQPLNQTYHTATINFNVTAVDETGMDSCVYTLNNGVSYYPMTNSSTSPTYWTATNTTMSEGSHTSRFDCNDTSNNINNSESVTFLVDTLPPVITLTSPTNNTHTNTTANFTAQITDGALANATLYIYNSSSDLFYSEFKAFAGGDLGIEYDLAVDDTYTWFYNATDVFGQQSQGGAFTIVYDTTHPALNWYNPTTSVLVSSSPYTINVSASDPYLDATNVTIYNATGIVIFTNFSGNLTDPIWWMVDDVTLNEGINILEICARDSLESSPIIFDTADFTKRNAEETEYVMPDGNVVVRELVIKDEFNNKLDAVAIGLVTTEEWVEGGRHYKTTWEFDDIGDGFMEIVMYDDNGDLELKTDRGVTRVVDRGRNYYWNYGDMEDAGFELEYDVKEDGQIEIKATKGSYVVEGGRWIVDPIVAGLNTICENQTIRLDTTSPTAQSGGASGSGTSPTNRSFTNQGATNFTVNASDVGGIQNATLFILNESDDVINATTQEGYGAVEIFLGIVYNLWYEGVYKWFFRVTDTIGNAINTSRTQLTYDITAPQGAITYPLSISYDHQITSMNVSITETNIDSCWYNAGSGNVSITETTSYSGVSPFALSGIKTFGAETGTSSNVNDSDQSTRWMFNTSGGMGVVFSSINYTIIKDRSANVRWLLNFSNTADIYVQNDALSPCTLGFQEWGCYYNWNNNSWDTLWTSIGFLKDNHLVNVSVPDSAISDAGLVSIATGEIYTGNEAGKNVSFYETWIDYEVIGTNCSENITGLASSEGSNTWYFWVNDSVGFINQSSVTFIQDTTPPTAQSGGSTGSGGGTSPQNDSYTNQTAQNFTVNASDDIGIQNVTFFVLNESDDVINQTTTDFGGALDVFFGFMYNLWYEGIYKWFFRVVDTVGNAVDSVISVITYDVSSPNVTFSTYITNVSTDSLPTNISINYEVNETNVGACYYNIDGGSNLALNCSKTAENISVSGDGFHNLTIIGIDLANNSQEDTRPFYIFYHTYNQTTVSPTTTEGSLVTFDIIVNETDYFDTIAYLVYKGIEYRADSYNIVGDTVSFTKDLIIPDGTGNATGGTASWNWKYQIEGNSWWESNYSTSSASQTVYSVEMDNCSSYSDIILHFDLNDEETDTTLPFTIGNLSITPTTEAEVQIVSVNDPDLNWQFNDTWVNQTEGDICVPVGLLNYSSYRFDGVLSYIAEDYVQEFWYVDNGTLALNDPTLNDYTNRNITLRDLLLDDSTTFLFKYYDDNYLIKEGAVVTLLRKYIGEGVFKEAERCQLDNNGECHFHLVEEDVIYKFRVTDESALEYESGEYNAKCVETPCQITLQKGAEVGEWDEEHDNLPEGTYELTSNASSRIVTLDFNLEETGNMELDVFQYSNVINSPDTLVCSDSATAKTGTIDCLVPLSYGNETYYAVVRHDTSFVTSVWVDMKESGYNYFGALGLFLGALLILTLGLIAISSGGWTIGFLILGLVIASVTKLVQMDFYLIMWVVCAGGLIIWKLSTRRSI